MTYTFTSKNRLRFSPAVDARFWGECVAEANPDASVSYHVHANWHNAKILEDIGFMPDEPSAARFALFRHNEPAPTPNRLTMPLRDFQQEGLDWLAGNNGNGILADAMGLGKTAQTIALIAAKPLSYTPVVVIAPAHVKLNWQDEWEKFTSFNGQCEVLFGRTPSPLGNGMVYVLNHHILEAWIDELTRIKPKMLVVDEAHNFVSHGTKTYPLVQRLARECGRVLLLTGTPLVNKLEDVWSLCNLVNPALLGTKGAFEEIFIPEAKAMKKAFASSHWTAPFIRKRLFAEAGKMKHPKPVRDRLTSELGDMLRSTVMKRRVWSDVGVQMPEIIDQTVWLPVDDKDFWQAEEEIKEAYKANPYDFNDGEKFKAFAAGRANAARHKLEALQEWLESFLEETEDEKVVICGWSVAPLTELHAKFKKKSVLVNGTLTAEEKHRRTNVFQSDPDIRILFGNIKSIGTGINLTAASVMGFLELPLTDADYVQCRSRLRRLSMTAKSLRYYDFLIKDSFEHNVVKRIILCKRDAGKLLLDGVTETPT